MYERRALPPLSALTALEAAARTGGFGKAAQSLSLTQSAISRQIALLEDHLGLKLFERVGRGVVLTDAGRLYAERISSGLDRIREATGATMTAVESRERLAIATLPGFGVRWLAPRLPSLLALHPGLEIDFTARTAPFDFARDPVDAAIHFGEAYWPGARSDLLFGEETAAVCSPAVAKRLHHPGDILKQTLLLQRTRPIAWLEWSEKAGLPPPTANRSLMFDQFMMMIETAVAGVGVALAPKLLVERELAQGALVQPFEPTLVSTSSYYLVYTPEKASKLAFVRFREWLLQECGQPAPARSASPAEIV
jgi:LysR family glycine cleavage system transcriptional activator